MKDNLSYFERQTPVLAAEGLPRALVNIGKQRGVHPDKLLKDTQLFYQDLTDASTNKKISHQQWVTLVNNAQKLIAQDDLSFMLGRALPSTLPAHLLHAIEHSDNLAQVLRLVSKQQLALCPHYYVSIKNHNKRNYWLMSEAISVEHQQYQIFMCELFASSLVNIIKLQHGHMPTDIAIRMPYKQPKYIEQYHSYLGGNCQFIANAGFNAMQINIDNQLLFKPFKQADKHLMQHYQSDYFCANNLPMVGLLQWLNQLIEQQIQQHGQASLEHTAEQMNVSVATLKRKLSQHNTSFQRLLDQHRQQQAIFKLTEQGLSNEQVAEQLNFNDLTNFRRAIKRWTGLTPSALKLFMLSH